ncbi:MAG: archaellin/type IV pilin N-terminal domain-containing protein [archaeon]
MVNKKGVSPVIASVLLILVTIVAVALISAFIIPMIKEQMTGGGNCFKVLGKMEIDSDAGYTCKNITSGETMVMVKRQYIGDEDIKVTKIVFSLIGQGNSQVIQIFDNTINENVRKYSGSYNQSLTLVPEGGALTYVFNTGSAGLGINVESVDVAPVLGDGTTCNPVSSKMPEC